MTVTGKMQASDVGSCAAPTPNPPVLCQSGSYLFQRLISHHKRVLAFNSETGAIVNVAPFSENVYPLILMWSPSNPRWCFLIADLSETSVVKDPSSMIVACEMERINETKLSLRHLGTRAYLSARNADQQWLVLPMPERKGWEVFTLAQDEDSKVGSVTLSVMGRLASVLEEFGAGLNKLLLELAASKEQLADRIITSGLVSLMRECDGRSLLAEFCEAPAIANSLQKIFAGDFYATDAIPRLVAWCISGGSSARPPSSDGSSAAEHSIASRVERIGPERDHLAYDFRTPSPMLELNALLRAGVMPRAGGAVLTTARNEGLYLLEWVAYYRVLGFERIFIVSNQNDDSSDELLHLLSEHGMIDLTISEVAPGCSAQDKGYGYHLRAAPEILDYRWLFICDMDEFLVIDPSRFADLQSFLEFHSAVGGDSIGINWVMYCSDNRLMWHDEPMISRFRTPEEAVNRHVKTMSKPANLLHSLPHHPIYRLGFTPKRVTAQGKPHVPGPKMGFSGTAEPDPCGAVVNHYFYRSAAEFFTKFARNRGDHPVSLGRSAQALPESMLVAFIKQFGRSRNDMNPEPLRIMPLVEGEKRRLRALPGIRAAEEKVHRAFVAHLPDIITLFEKSSVVAMRGNPATALLQDTRTALQRYETSSHCQAGD